MQRGTVTNKHNNNWSYFKCGASHSSWFCWVLRT